MYCPYLNKLLKINCVFFAFHHFCQASSVPSIGIIGAGIGGTFSGLYLRQLFGENDSFIDIYEQKKVGGRAALANIGDNYYEAGGSVIHSRNLYLSTVAKTLGLEKKTAVGGKLAIFNGKEHVFSESSNSLLNYIDLIWRYGWSLVRWNTLINDMLDKFDRIYRHHDKGYCFTSVDKLLASMDPSFVKYTQTTTREFLEVHGFSTRIIDELIAAIIRVNYGQTVNVNGFVGAVNMAAADSTLWSVEGGNYKLAEGALNLSNAKLINSKAESITFRDGKYVISSTYFDENNNLNSQERTYDIVIVTAPQTSDLASIKFVNFPHIHADFPGHYHRLFVTFVEGNINPNYFGLSSSDDVGDIINIDTDVNYNSVSRNYPVEATKVSTNVWKIFSQLPLNSSALDEMFNKIASVKVVDWLAYPEYSPPEKLGTFQLHDRLYYTNSIEWAASAMEMNAVAARNVALLAFNQWLENNDLIDAPDIPEVEEDRTEF